MHHTVQKERNRLIACLLKRFSNFKNSRQEVRELRSLLRGREKQEQKGQNSKLYNPGIHPKINKQYKSKIQGLQNKITSQLEHRQHF